MEYDADAAIRRFRIASDRLLAGRPSARWTPFVNPGEGQPVPAEEFLSHLNLDAPGVNAVLRGAFPYFDRRPGMKGALHARLRALGWMTLRMHNRLLPAYKALAQDKEAQRLLGFCDGLPCYDTFREMFHERLSGGRFERLMDAMLAEETRLEPALGGDQAQDATPNEARRREEDAPYHPHYKVRMHKVELRWDVGREALLAHQFYRGTAHEGKWLVPLTKRVRRAGVKGKTLTVDGSYTSFALIAWHWRHGLPLKYRRQEGWAVDEEEARAQVERRFERHWQHRDFPVGASWEEKLRFLVDHGSPHDVEAVGRWVRDHELSTQTEEGLKAVKQGRSENEGFNAELKRLPFFPARRGAREMLRRVQACTFTLHAVQLTRLKNGVRGHLCRTADIV